MPGHTNEQALEASIEWTLTGTCREDRENQAHDAAPSYLDKHLGYQPGMPGDYDRVFAIDREKFWSFLESTQAAKLDKLRDRPNWQRLVLERLNKKIKKDSLLGVLKKGLAIDDAHLTRLYRLPYNQLNPEVTELFNSNIFSITRQVYYSESDPLLSIDMVLFINGLTVATFELKNPWTGQTVVHAKKQYREDRDPSEPLFQFGRCLVHFAVDPDEVFMTTHINAGQTYFLPLNLKNISWARLCGKSGCGRQRIVRR